MNKEQPMAGGLVLLVDLGSTFTKAAAVDSSSRRLVARTQHPSTADSDITLGLNAAFEELCKLGGFQLDDVSVRLACSSAKGGLRLVAVGLVPQLTTEAAKRAALGAGAKVIKVYSHDITEADVREIEALEPDLILLTGGTDGGNATTITQNARCLAGARVFAPVIMAGNRSAREEVRRVLTSAGRSVYVADNVMPELGVLNVEGARRAIREAFVRHIVQAKGLDRAAGMMDQPIVPTPAVVLDAARLLADGTDDDPGVGDVLVVDVGGATTDVHSVTRSRPAAGMIERGLPEPDAKRTVEGDLGIRSNAPSIVEAALRPPAPVESTQWESQTTYRLRPDLAEALSTCEARREAAALTAQPSRLPLTETEAELDRLLASAATDLAVGRHAGWTREIFGPTGQLTLLYGKDLRAVQTLVGVGGVFAAGVDPGAVLSAALFREDVPESLRPMAPARYIDAEYVFYAAGLLAPVSPHTALNLLRTSLRRIE